MDGNPNCNQILGLDFGQTTGWSLFDRTTGMWSWGEIGLKEKAWEGGGVEFLRWRNWLEMRTTEDPWSQPGYLERALTPIGTCLAADPTAFLIAYEQVAGTAMGPAKRIIDGQRAILLAHCENHQIPYAAVNVSALKKWATGKGSTPGKGTPKVGKEEMIASVRDRWKEFAPNQRKPVKLTDNEADALLVGWWALREVAPPGWIGGSG